jgi:tripartite-type tricarboxylate transporter receptor subunit TctC
MGLFVPAGTPREIVDRLWQESKKALADPALKPILANLALTPVASSPQEFDKMYFADRKKFQRIIEEAHIPLQD